MKKILVLIIGIVGFAAAASSQAKQAETETETDAALRARAARLHREAIVLDTHADLTPFIQKDTKPAEITDPGLAGPGYDPSTDPLHAPILTEWARSFPPGPWSFTERHPDGYMDLPRMKEGGLDAEFFSIYMDEERRPGMSVMRALEQIESIRTLCEKYPGDIALATTADDVRNIVASGRIAALMGVEGGYMIEDSIRVLRAFYALGVRYMSLSHAFNTHWADSSGIGDPISPRHGGLSPFGVEVVKEMNRLGMMVDVSHVADSTFFDALAASEAPVIASHSSVDGVKEHARNMSDDMLRALAKNGGSSKSTPSSSTSTPSSERRHPSPSSSTTSPTPSRSRDPTTWGSGSTTATTPRRPRISRTSPSFPT